MTTAPTPPPPKDDSFVLNPSRGFVRYVDHSLFPFDRFASQLLHWSENIIVVSSRVPGGARGPRPHLHDRDQVFVPIHGELTLHLGANHYKIRRGDVAHIPAGTPHAHRNETTEDELHLELIVPGPPPGASFVEFLSSEEGWTPGGTVLQLKADAWESSSPGFSMQWLLDPSATGGYAFADSPRLSLYEGRIDPGHGGDSMHVHEFDQFCYVIEGSVEVTVGLQVHEVTKHGLIILPAGVPHRQRNIGAETNSYIGFHAPPERVTEDDDGPWGRNVDFGPKSKSP